MEHKKISERFVCFYFSKTISALTIKQTLSNLIAFLEMKVYSRKQVFIKLEPTTNEHTFMVIHDTLCRQHKKQI